METSQPYRIYTPEALGSAIRHYRQEAGLTQEELAERAGLNRLGLAGRFLRDRQMLRVQCRQYRVQEAACLASREDCGLARD